MLAAAVALVSCEMDFYSSDTMTSSMLAANPDAAVYTTDGNYAMLKDEIDYSNTRSGNDFSRLYFLMHELRGDNVSLCARSTDPLYEDLTYADDPTKADLSYMWYICYKIIYGCNTNIEAMKEGTPETNHLIGENYFLRAFCHFTLCNLFATPYTLGDQKRPDEYGVIIRTSTDVSKTERAKVGKVYEQIVADLKEAIRLMEGSSRGTNKGYASFDAARGLLTRVYLYMGENELCAQLCDEMLGTAPAANLHPQGIENYYPNTLTSPETLWCIGKSQNDPGFISSPGGELASIYYTPMDDLTLGWAEQSWSDPLLDLMMRHPEDKRLTYFVPFFQTNDGQKMVTYPRYDEKVSHRVNEAVHSLDFDVTAETNSFTYGGTTYTVKKKDVNGYPAYYIENLYADDVDKDDITGGTRCYVRDNQSWNKGFHSKTQYSAPIYAMSKFSYQDGLAMLASPAVIRWAEIVLNRAEANAKIGGKDQAVLDDLNVIRTRAGIPTWGSEADWKAEGYKELLDVVLDERRLELCFEGHRALDLYRNNRSIDRRFAGAHTYEVLTPEQLDKIYPYCIPFDEISVTHIPGNGKNY